MKRLVLLIFSVLGGLFIGLLIGEIGLRASNIWIGRHSDTMFTLIEHDEQLGWRMKPNLNQKVDLVDVENIPIQTNSLGFWDREFFLEKSPGRCRIVFLGDSFTWGMGVRKEERFSSLIEKANPQWESLNFGVSGYGTDQSLILWGSDAKSYQPDAVVLTVYQNDYVDNMDVVRYGRRKPYFELKENSELLEKGIPVNPAHFWNDGIFNQAAPPYVQFFEEPIQKRSRILHWLAKNSDLARFVYTRWRTAPAIARPEGTEHRHPESQFSVDRRRIGAKDLRAHFSGRDPSAAPRPQDDVLLPRNDERERKQVELLVALVTQLFKEAQSADAKFIVAFAGDLTPEHQAAMEALKEKSVPFVDVTTEVLKRQPSLEEGGVYYRYSKHWTPAAHRAAAQLLAETIKVQKFCHDTH